MVTFKTSNMMRKLVLVLAAALSMGAFAQTSGHLSPSSPDNILAPAASYEEILATFQREAAAAYAQAKKECTEITDSEERKQCLARARLQYDADRRYARQRAEMGH